GRPASARGEVAVALEDFDLAILGVGVEGAVSGAIGAAGSVAGGRPEGTLDAELAGTDLAAAGQDGPSLSTVVANVWTDGRRVEAERIEGVLSGLGPEQGVPFEVRGRADLDPGVGDWLRSIALEVRMDRPYDGIESLMGDASLADGALRFELRDLAVADGVPAVEAFLVHAPLGGLGAFPGAGDILDAVPTPRADGPVTGVVDVPRLDTEELAGWLGLEPPAQRFTAAVEGSFTFDPGRPSLAAAEITLGEAVLELPGHRIAATESLVGTLRNGSLGLPKTIFTVDGHPFTLEASADLDPGWTPERPAAEGVTALEVVADGALPASLLDPYLAGGLAEGLMEVQVTASGPPADLEVDIALDAPDASVTWLAPYATRLEAPRGRMRMGDGKFEIEELLARLNNGEIDVVGQVDFGDDGEGRPPGLQLDGLFDRLRFRLDYGLTVLLAGNFSLQLPFVDGPAGGAEGARLTTNVLVERGSLRRNLDTDRELLALLLEPPALGAGEAPELLRQIELRADIATVDGVIVKNNVADLRASWAPLRVEGTLAEPRILGSIEVEPGGRVYAYGQVVRLDRAVMSFPRPARGPRHPRRGHHHLPRRSRPDHPRRPAGARRPPAPRHRSRGGRRGGLGRRWGRRRDPGGPGHVLRQSLGLGNWPGPGGNPGSVPAPLPLRRGGSGGPAGGEPGPVDPGGDRRRHRPAGG
ncbi:MAG: hypothetical protein AAGD06_23945, partial [Acidobacteriota bacterium]